MKLIDYTGKLNNHTEYLQVLKQLKIKSKYIEMVILDEKESNDLINKFKDDVIVQKKVSKWWGTKTKTLNYLYRLKVSDELFKYLSQFETFCKYYEANEIYDYDRQETTDFGIDDIAFYDKNKVPLLCTTTHECYISIREDFLDDLLKKD